MDIICGLVADITTEELIVELGPVQLGSGTAYEIYSGPYEVEPLRTAQILATRSMAMRDDVNVHGVSFSKTKNPAGGTTCNIGGAN